MNLRFWRSGRDSASTKKPYVSGTRRSSRLAAAAAAALACLSPLAERLSRADEAQQPRTGETESRQPETNPSSPATGPDGTAVIPPQAPQNPANSDSYQGENQQTEPQTTEPLEPPLFFTNLDLLPVQMLRSPFQDPALAASPAAVDATGQRRDVGLDNSWDLGGNILATEAGIAAFGAVRFQDLVRSDFGVLSFNGQPFDPFIRLYLRPQLNVGRATLTYHGSVAFMDGMPSWVYTTHLGALGFSYPIRLTMSDDTRRLWLRFGAVGGLSLSHPAYDDLYANLAVGASIQLTGYPNPDFDYLLYFRTTYYAAADDPMKTAYVAYYEPRLQSMEVGAQIRIFGDYSLRPFVELGELKNTYALGGIWAVKFDEVELDFYIAVGATQYSDLLNQQVIPVLRLGATIVVGSTDVNSTNTSYYAHDQDAATRDVTRDVPARDSGLYGFGNSGDPAFDVAINEAKNRILDSESFTDFANSYRGRSTEDLLLTARFLGAVLRAGYAMDAMNAMMSAGFFDEPVQRIASATNDDIFGWLKQYVDWANVNGINTPLPDNLRNGIAVCAGIHWLIADFLYINGIRTAAASVNTPGAPHVITIAMLSDRTVIIDYGNMYQTGPGSLDEVLRFYGMSVGAPVLQSQIFLPERDGYVITYVTPEGEFFHRVVGIETNDVLLNEILGVRAF